MPDADEGIIYQHSVLCHTCLPYRNPGDTHRRWTRKNGFLTLEVDAGRAFDSRVADFVDVGLPYGPKPRLVLYHLNAEALRTRSPVIELEDSLTAFVRRTLSLDAHGRNIQTVRDQLTRLAASEFRIGKSDADSSTTRGASGSRNTLGRAFIAWKSLAQQFGHGYAQVRGFRRVFKRTLAQVKVVYPDAKFDLTEEGMRLHHSRPPVMRRLLPVSQF